MNISINTYNNIHRQFIRQENLSSKQETSHSLESGKKYYVLTRRGKAKRKALLLVVQWIINQRIKYETVFAYQETIADDIGIHVRHLRKIIRQLKADKWLTVIDTPSLCNIYILNPIFDDKSFCIGMNYAFNNLLVDKEIYRIMYASKAMQNSKEQKSISDIKQHQYQETVYEDERFIPKETDRTALDEIFGLPVSNKIYEKSDCAKMPSIYKDEYTCENFSGKDFDTEYTSILYTEINEPTKGVIEDIFSSPSSLKSKSIGILTKKGSTAMQALPTRQETLPCVDKLKSIYPTLHGTVILSAFPEEVILHADQRTLKCKKPLLTALDRWKYLMVVCKGYCADNKIETSWAKALKTRDQYNLTDKDPLFDETHVPEKNYTPILSTTIKQKLASQWKDESPNIDKKKEFSGAIDTLKEMASTNPFAALLMRNVERLEPQKVGCSESVVAKPFDQETLDIVDWIKGHWDDKLFPHSNKWVHENIARVMQEGSTSPQYLDGSFLSGMKHIKRLMETLLKRPVPTEVTPIDSVDDVQGGYDECPDPFGDRL